jgi:transposase
MAVSVVACSAAIIFRIGRCGMEAIIERCCGLDVHQATVVACLLIGSAGPKPRKEVRTFGTTTRELLQLRDWLAAEGCTHVGMESTGVYWMPVNAILEDDFELVIGNAQQIRNVPGRKTDIKDSEWIADLLRHGLMASSFVPPKPIRELRELLRYRRKVVEARTAERNRLLKLLETANIKLAGVVSDVFGVSGMLMLRAILEGEATPEQMAQLARGRARRKIDRLAPALEGRVEDHHRFVLRMQLRRLEQADADVSGLDARIASKIEPYAQQHRLLKQIPGVDRTLAAVLIAELGTDMTVFHSGAHLASWAGVCPGNHESAGKRKSGRTRKGNIFLKSALVEAATSASRKKSSYLKDKFWRLKSRRGPKRAAMAIAHKILLSAYRMLATGNSYQELGDSFLDRLDTTRTVNNLKRRIERLGYVVRIERPEPSPATAA